MKLLNSLNEHQIKLCKKADINLENKDYNLDELYNIEQRLLEYLNLYCIDEDDEVTSLGEEYEDLIDLLVDLEDAENPEKPGIESYVEENDKVKMKDGRTGTLVDITENMYTVEIDDKYKTGKVDEDILIVESSEIVDFRKPVDSIEDIEDENRNKIDED